MKSYLRFLFRNKLYTTIEVVGLSISLAFVIIFTCYVRQQFAVCNHYPDSQNIYLVGVKMEYFTIFFLWICKNERKCKKTKKFKKGVDK